MPEPTATDAKATLREQVLARRNELDAAFRATASAEAARRVIALIGAGQLPRALSTFAAIGSEIDPQAITDWAHANGVEVVLPEIPRRGFITFRRHRAGEPLVAGSFGTRGPMVEAPAVDPEFIVLPMLAFDRAGTRLGYGKGHYDRAIAGLRQRGQRPTLVGLAFAAQEVATIPAEPHDARLDWVVTERETLDLRRG